MQPEEVPAPREHSADRGAAGGTGNPPQLLGSGGCPEEVMPELRAEAQGVAEGTSGGVSSLGQEEVVRVIPEQEAGAQSALLQSPSLT